MEHKQTSPAVNAKSETQIETPIPEEIGRVVTKGVAGPYLAAARVMLAAEGNSGFGEDIDPAKLSHCLLDQTKAVNRGDMTQVEAMLVSQATALQTLFARLTEKGMVQGHMPNLEGYLRMALRAQNQCRATLETLVAIKNPPLVIAKQANINHGNGNQQVNNGTHAPATHAEKTINQQNELLEAQYGERMDTGTAGTTIGKDKAMAAMG